MVNLKNIVVNSLVCVFFINMYFDRGIFENKVNVFLGFFFGGGV